MFVRFRRFFVFAAMVISAATAEAAQRAEHVFIICLDGGKPEVMQKSEMPVLNKLVAEGAHTWGAQTVMPSLTLPAFASMLTGTLPEKHKVLWNDFEPGKGVVGEPTVFTQAKKAGLSTAMFVGKQKFRTLAQPGTVDKFSFDSPESIDVTKVMDGMAKPMTEGTVRSKIVAPDAAKYILAKKPNLCFIHFTDTDDTGHKYGWGSPQQMKAFADEDAGIAVILKAIQDAGIAEQSVIIISADHGGHNRTHGSNRPEDMTIPWIVWGKGVKKGSEITAPVNICDTMATVCWLLDVPAPEGIAGKPVTSAFE
jgi:predicted AlkP superfamily pyrophosphatase or phosphodiesterase